MNKRKSAIFLKRLTMNHFKKQEKIYNTNIWSVIGAICKHHIL